MPGCRCCSRGCRPGRATRWWWWVRCTCWARMGWSRNCVRKATRSSASAAAANAEPIARQQTKRRPTLASAFCCGSAFAAGLARCRRRLGRFARGARRTAETGAHVALEFLPQLQVAFGELVHHRPRRLPEQVAHLLAELLLLVEEQLHAALQVIAHEALQRVAVKTDHLAQQLG